MQEMNPIKIQKGFTLIEVAVVLVIIGLVVGSFMGSFSQRIETTRRDETKKQLQDIKAALLGFASAEGRLPCPASATSAGESSPDDGVSDCNLAHGFVPGRTLGLAGAYNEDNLLLDSWRNPIRYSVASANGGNYDFVKTGQMQAVGMANLTPGLVVCDGDSTAVSSCSGSNTVVDDLPVVILSLGKDGSDFVGAAAPASDQGENAGEVAVTAGPEGLAYTVGNNRVFVSKDYSSADASAGQFDDLIIWISPYVLYSRMIEAGQLP